MTCACGFRGHLLHSRQHIAQHALHALGLGIIPTEQAEQVLRERSVTT